MTAINRTVTFIIITISVLLGLWYCLNPIFQPKAAQMRSATLVNSQHHISDFSLTTTNNQPFNQHNLRGHWTLMFFGYSDCPVICPSTLTLLRDSWQQFTKAPPVNFVFVNINPQQESLAELKAFLQRFHPDFVGATGSSAEIRKLSDQLGIFATNSGDTTEDGKPIIDHTATLMLINPHAKLHAVFTPQLDPVAIAQDLVTITNS